MRIALSGTHCTGKSTLAEDFVAAHPEYVHEPEPYEWLVELYGETPDFERQLEMSVERLCVYGPDANVIVERSPLDFLAYLRATGTHDPASEELAARGMEHVELLVVLPLDGTIPPPADEDPELREAMNEHLLEIVTGWDIRTIELHGDRRQRLETLERFIDARASSSLVR